MLSVLVFYMILYGIQRLLELSDTIEQIENERKRKIRQAAQEVELKPQPQEVKEPVVEQDPSKELQSSEATNDPTASIRIDPEDVYEVDNDLDKYEIVTYHRYLKFT